MISGIVLAAGESRRMGEPKLLMRWGMTTVLEHVVSVLSGAGLAEILVITGSHRNEIESIVSASSKKYPIRGVFNESYSTGEMLSSIQCGLRELLRGHAGAAIIALGDQPQIREGTVQKVCDVYRESGSPLVILSFNRRRGHPWLVERSLWKDILALRAPQTPRDFLNSHTEQIEYVEVDDLAILADLDTPEHYRDYQP